MNSGDNVADRMAVFEITVYVRSDRLLLQLRYMIHASYQVDRSIGLSRDMAYQGSGTSEVHNRGTNE